MRPSIKVIAASFIKNMKDRSGLTQSEIARRSDGELPQRTISRLEADPLAASVDNLSLYLQIIGSSLADMDAYIKAKEVESMETLQTTKTVSIQQAISLSLHKIDEAKSALTNNQQGLNVLEARGILEWFDETAQAVCGTGIKPIIGFYGLFDSAKSTLINTLLGEEWMPVGYQPETSIVNIIAHADDRPKWLHGEVAVFKAGFEPERLNDQEYAESLLIEQGSREILQRLGRHQYLEGTEDHKDAAISMVFVKSRAVDGIWLMDTPGDLNDMDGGSDRQKAEESFRRCHGIVYLSPATGFLSAQSLAFFNAVLKSLPPLPTRLDRPLDHVRIVMSHAHRDVSDRQIHDLKMKWANKFDQLANSIFKHWEDVHGARIPTAQEFIDRIVPFYCESNERRTATLNAISTLGAYCQDAYEERIKTKIDDYEKRLSGDLGGMKVQIEADMRSSSERIEEAETNYARFCKNDLPALKKNSQSIIELSRELSREARLDVKAWFHSNMTVDPLETYIKDNFSDKKEAQSDAPAIIMSRLDQYISGRMKRDSDNFSRVLDGFLAQWQVNVNANSYAANNGDISSISGGFDARAALLAGVVGLGSYGAMAVYVASLGNLGGYILAAKLAGLLASAGLITNVTTVTAALAAIGGPITIILALTIAIAGLVYKLFGSSWQHSLAKGIAEQIEKEDVLAQVLESIEKYWTDTTTAFEKGLAALENDTIVHYQTEIERAREEHDTTELAAAAAALSTATAILS